MSSKIHLSGIIPIANHNSEIDVKFPNVLLPLCDGFSAIQRSVFECAMAGCNTIWIVANEDMSPLIRKVIGDWIYDPVYYNRSFSTFPSEVRKEVPIYYVGIKPKDFNRRDSYGWSVLEGIHCAYMTSARISKWLTPEKYFVSFPFGIADPHQIREFRKEIRDKHNNFFYTHDNKNVKDNLPLSFTLTGDDFKLCRRAINKKTTREFLPPSPGHQFPSEKLPLHERWSARYFNFSDVFEDVCESSSFKHELEWFYDVSTWQGYRNYIASENIIKSPISDLTKPRQHVKIPYTSEE
tara:strand:- start:346 stop:1230 length:885 start_codon:yes stop_codon:yes gene_type:complete